MKKHDTQHDTTTSYLAIQRAVLLIGERWKRANFVGQLPKQGLLGELLLLLLLSAEHRNVAERRCLDVRQSTIGRYAAGANCQ